MTEKQSPLVIKKFKTKTDFTYFNYKYTQLIETNRKNSNHKHAHRQFMYISPNFNS